MQENAGSDLLQSWIARAAARAPDKPLNKPWVIVADDGRTISYGQLRDIAGRFATFLRRRGLGRNDRVALLANNSIEQLLCYFGVMAAGCTVCTVHVEMNRNQLDNIFERLKPKLILYQDGLQLDDLAGANIRAAIRGSGIGTDRTPTRCSPSLRAARRARRRTRRARTTMPSSSSPRERAPGRRASF